VLRQGADTNRGMRGLLRSVVVCGLGAFANAQSPLPEPYGSRGELRWGADAEGGAPFVFVEPAAPERGDQGFEVELAAALGAELGVRMVRVQAPYENLVPALDRGDFDLVLNGFEPTSARRAQVRFSRPYYVFRLQLSVGPAQTEVRELADLRGQRIGVLGQSAGHLWLAAQSGFEPVVYESNVTAYADVLNGRTAGSLADLPIARALRPQFPTLREVGAPFGAFHYCIAVRARDVALRDALDTALGALLADGSLERIYRRWQLWDELQPTLVAPSVANAYRDDAPALPPFDLWASAAALGRGALVTLGISVLAFALASGLGLLVALLRLHGPRPLRWATVVYVEALRGTPVLVQLLLLYYGLGHVEGLRLPAEVAGVLGLGLNYSAYEAEIYRGALQAIPRGQREAAQALGLSTAQALRHVLVPQALRLSLPATTNDFIALFKDSSIVMVITVVELTKQYQMLANASGHFLGLGLLTAGLYLAMSLPLALLARQFERWLERDRA
jgi:polar amino acid transport system substrate-binding protein